MIIIGLTQDILYFEYDIKLAVPKLNKSAGFGDEFRNTRIILL